MTIMEMIMALTIISLVFAAMLPQFRLINNSWDSKRGNAEVLQNGRVLMDHISRNLSKAVKINAVSDPCETNGYIEFEDNDGNNLRYEIDAGNYVEFGLVGNLSDLAGPVSSLQFTCYDDNDFSTSITDCNYIRLVNVQAVLTNSASMGQDKTFTTSAYLRTNDESTECWQNEDIGDVGAAGSSILSDSNWIIEGSGVDLGPLYTSDEFHFVYQTLSGDGQIIARVASIENTGAYAKAGVMIRETLDDDSKYAGMFVTPNNGVYFQNRTTTGQLATYTAGSGSQAPRWFKVTRTGDTLAGYESSDGSTWTQVGTDVSITMGTDVYIGMAVCSGNDGVLCTAEIDNVGFSKVEYQDFNEAKVSTADTSVTISTPGDSSTVEILGSWTSGLTHTAEAGSNRLLVFTAHAEEAGAINLTSVTYGGQSMTKVIDEIVGTTFQAYVVTYILDEADIAAASGNTFVLTWSTTPDEVSYSSVFLSNVDQTTPIGATDDNGTAAAFPNPITTSALSTANGDMAIVAATCGNAGNYTVDSDFTEAIELDMATSVGVTGYKTATGSDETPSVTHSVPNRQVIIGLVVQSGGIGGIEGDLLIAAVATDGDTSSLLAAPGGEEWTKINAANYGGEVTLGAWWKLADASESATHQFTWSGDEQAYGWIMRFTGHDPTDPINTWSAGGDSDSTPTSSEVTTTVDNCLILRLGAFDDDDITIDDPGLSSHTAITMDESASSGGGAVSILGSWATGTTHAQEAGTDRVLIFIAHEESTIGSPTLTSVKYGEEAMTKVIERSAVAGAYGNYVAAFIMNEAGINAATSSTFFPTWSAATSSFSYASVFLENVDQADIIGATDSASTTIGTNPIETSPLSTEDGDMVILAAVCGNNGSYTLNGFTEGSDQSVGMYGHTGVTGHKAATGANETPSATHTAPNRQAIIGFVVQTGAGAGDTVSGGAGYILQTGSGGSGTSDFTLNSANEAQMITIAIAPENLGTCDGTIRP